MEYVIPIYVEVTYSPVVGKFGSSYFEGILQLRNATQEIKDYITKYFDKNAGRNVFVNNVVEKDNSVDYFFVTKRHILPLANKLIRNFGGYYDPNEQLFSRNHLTSKDLFRLNVLVLVAPFKAKDVVLIDEQPILISRLGKIITGFNLKKGKKYTFSYDEKTKDKVKVMKKYKTTVSKIMPDLEILEPETYQPVSANNPKELDLKLGEKIKCVKFKKDYYVIG